MTEQEMLEAAKYIAEHQHQLIEANTKLFEAGVFAGQQSLQIDRLGKQITVALHEMEAAHQACHQGDRMTALHAIARAMEALAQEATDD